MGRKKNILERVVHGADLMTEPIPLHPLLELVGDHRILIENHHGVTQYGCEEIHVNTKLGCICIGGIDLELALMTKERLVITGRIHSIHIRKGGKK